MSTSIRVVMPAPPRLHVEAAAGSAFELLVGLYTATSPDGVRAESWVPERATWSRELTDALAAAGERSGEAWLHLLGLALELPSTDAATFVDEVSRLPARELRRHLVGVYVPAWVGMLGAATLERAAAGNAAAIEQVLAHPRYYAGRAAESLGPLVELPARETKARIVGALSAFATEALAPREHEIAAALVAGANEVATLIGALAPGDVIQRVTRGYVYEPEPELERVLLVPHLAARPALLLCQHRSDRIICFPLAEQHADPETALAEKAVALGRALGDERRVQVLRHLAFRDASLEELAGALGLARSTAHHHLGQLRAAGLVELHGNARGYWYALRAEGLDDAGRTLAELAASPAAVPRKAKRRSKRR